jgi:lysophospholipase L1-like esterase
VPRAGADEQEQCRTKGQESEPQQIMDALAEPFHPDHAEHAAWVAEIAGSVEPFGPPLPAHTRREPVTY